MGTAEWVEFTYKTETDEYGFKSYFCCHIVKFPYTYVVVIILDFGDYFFKLHFEEMLKTLSLYNALCIGHSSVKW